MAEKEDRTLSRAAVILLVASLARVGWTRLGPDSALPQGRDAAAGMLAESRAALSEAEARTRPLADGERIDPNVADAIELDRLPGVGPATAEAIVRSREEDGPFLSPQDLQRVRGIGSATIGKLAPVLDFPAPLVARVRPRGAPDGIAPRVDVNRAGEAELQTLPGVGPALARRIVEARAEAPFRSPEDLGRVRGIGAATLERLRPLVAVGPR